MKHEPRTWPMALDIDDGDADALDQPEPEFSIRGRCDRCLRPLRGDGTCRCEESRSASSSAHEGAAHTPDDAARPGAPSGTSSGTTLPTCPFCGRMLVAHDGRLREHLPPGRWAQKKCPGSGSRVEPAVKT